MLHVILSALLGAPAAPPTIGSVQGLSPEAVGRAVLANRDRGPIETVVPAQLSGPIPPGLVQLQLVERPQVTSRGCVRRRWTASFMHQPDMPQSSAKLQDAWASTEIALASSPDCSRAAFVHLNPGLGIVEAFDALVHLENIRAGRAEVTFTCLDETASRLCDTPAAIREALGSLPAWAISRARSRDDLPSRGSASLAPVMPRANGPIEIWLDTPGQVVTAVSFSNMQPDHVTVERRIPAPF